MEEYIARKLSDKLVRKVSEVLWSPLRRRYQKQRIQHFILSISRDILSESFNVANIFASATILCMIVLCFSCVVAKFVYIISMVSVCFRNLETIY